jgi:hypothetical protein
MTHAIIWYLAEKAALSKAAEEALGETARRNRVRHPAYQQFAKWGGTIMRRYFNVYAGA